MPYTNKNINKDRKTKKKIFRVRQRGGGRGGRGEEGRGRGGRGRGAGRGGRAGGGQGRKVNPKIDLIYHPEFP